MLALLKGAAEKSAKRDPQDEPQKQGRHSVIASSSTRDDGYNAPFASKFASLSLHMSDRIRLMDFPREIVDLVRQAIQVSWPRGIQEERVYAGSYEYKLGGRPWSQHYEPAQAERLMRTILEWLYNAGWVLGICTDISTKHLDKDTLIFRHQAPAPAQCHWLSFGFDRSDRIRVLDAPPELVTAISNELAPLIQDLLRPSVAGAWEAKLYGRFWHATGEETMASRRLLLRLFAILEQHGYTLYCSNDQRYTIQDKVTETDTWHCCRPLTWTPGAPVYHR